MVRKPRFHSLNLVCYATHTEVMVNLLGWERWEIVNWWKKEKGSVKLNLKIYKYWQFDLMFWILDCFSLLMDFFKWLFSILLDPLLLKMGNLDIFNLLRVSRTYFVLLGRNSEMILLTISVNYSESNESPFPYYRFQAAWAVMQGFRLWAPGSKDH